LLKHLTPALLALSVLAGIAGRVEALTANEINPNDTSNYYQQLDRESRGGASQ
jgi:hypothetical protein